jgi:hypothetical protein
VVLHIRAESRLTVHARPHTSESYGAKGSSSKRSSTVPLIRHRNRTNAKMLTPSMKP